MISRRVIIFAIAAFSLSIAGVASAQPRWGRDRLPQIGACFYEHINFGGRHFCVRPGERLRSLPGRMGDEISSMRLVGSAEVIIFRDKDMRGRSSRFTLDERDLRREGWNDQISSLEVSGRENRRGDDRRGDDRRGDDRRGDDRRGDSRGPGDRGPVWGREALPRAGACFYRDADFRGQYFCVARGDTYAWLPPGFNDSISSIRVFGAGVRLYQDRDYRGRSTEIRRDVGNLRGSWRDTVSSIRVF